MRIMYLTPFLFFFLYTAVFAAATNTINEQVQCNFKKSQYLQECYDSDKKYRCTGEDSCTIKVNSVKKQKFIWKSSCNGSVTTTVSGTKKTASFTCTAKQGINIKDTTQSSVPMVSGPLFEEQMKCIFKKSTTPQKCHDSTNTFTCSGVDSCSVTIKGMKWQRFTWKSSCNESTVNTKITSDNKAITFQCSK